MRSIKFRAFINGEMIYDLAYEEYAPINDLLEGTDNLMQFTGLFDKQGVKIYEGDIVKDLRSLFIDNRANSRVFYQEDRGRYVFGGWEIPAGMMHTFEVIGNIYENPELLEDKQ